MIKLLPSTINFIAIANNWSNKNFKFNKKIKESTTFGKEKITNLGIKSRG